MTSHYDHATLENVMDDLVTRLRARRGAERSLDPWGPDPDCAEAADEIVRLRAELRTALAEAEALRDWLEHKFKK